MTKIQPSKIGKPRSISAKLLLAGIVSVALFGLLLSSVVGLFNKYMAIRSHIAGLKVEQQGLKEKQSNITQMNSYIATPEGQESIFRDKYRLVKPGEQMIVITNDSDNLQISEPKKSTISRLWSSILSGLGIR